MGEEKKAKDLILNINAPMSLQGFFFERLDRVNEKSERKLPSEIIYYSSMILSEYGAAGQFFDVEEGKVKEKTLGIKYLEAFQKEPGEQKRIFKEVGDMTLLICGFFSESFRSKLIDSSYYHGLGVGAYQRLNSIEPECFDFPSFYRKVSEEFNQLTSLFGLVAKDFQRMQKNAESLIDAPGITLFSTKSGEGPQ